MRANSEFRLIVIPDLLSLRRMLYEVEKLFLLLIFFAHCFFTVDFRRRLIERFIEFYARFIDYFTFGDIRRQ